MNVGLNLISKGSIFRPTFLAYFFSSCFWGDISFYCLYGDIVPLSRRDAFIISKGSRLLQLDCLPFVFGAPLFLWVGCASQFVKYDALAFCNPHLYWGQLYFIVFVNIRFYLMTTSLKRLWAAAHSQFSPSGVVFHSKGPRKRASGKAA